MSYARSVSEVVDRYTAIERNAQKKEKERGKGKDKDKVKKEIITIESDSESESELELSISSPGIIEFESESETESENEIEYELETESESESEKINEETEEESDLSDSEFIVKSRVEDLTIPFYSSILSNVGNKKKRKVNPEEKSVIKAIEETYQYPYRDDIEDSETALSEKYTPEQLKEFETILHETLDYTRESTPSIFDIMKNNFTIETRSELLEYFSIFMNTPEFSAEKLFTKKYLIQMIENNSISKDDRKKLDSIQQVQTKNYNLRDILRLETTEQNVKYIYTEFCGLKNIKEDSDSYYEKKEWIRKVMSIPFGKYTELPKEENIKEYLQNVKKELSNCVSFMNDVKNQIYLMIGMMVRSQDAKPKVIAMEGPPGVGKTRLAMRGIAHSLGRKFFSIPAGTLTSESSLSGDRRVYIGSEPGLIIKGIMNCGVMDPVILIDELDKINIDGTGGRSILNTIVHLLDPTQNHKFKDSFFGNLEFDLSRAIFVVTYNNRSILDDILQDRMEKIRIEPPTKQEKVEIVRSHILPDILSKNKLTYTFPKESIEKIIHNTKEEKGCRQLSRNIENIVTRINMIELTEESKELSEPEIKELLQSKIVTESVTQKLFWQPKEESIPTHLYT